MGDAHGLRLLLAADELGRLGAAPLHDVADFAGRLRDADRARTMGSSKSGPDARSEVT